MLLEGGLDGTCLVILVDKVDLGLLDEEASEEVPGTGLVSSKSKNEGCL